MTIFLIGFMACGKTTTGKRLAKALAYQCLDLDAFIVQKEQQSIAEIFEQYGEGHFRNLEKKYLTETFSSPQTVVATGGGAACFFDNIQQMNQHGLTIYLKASPALLCSRLWKQKQHRPLVSRLASPEALYQFIEGKLEERNPFYEQAQWIVDIGNYRFGELHQVLAERIKREVHFKT